MSTKQMTRKGQKGKLKQNSMAQLAASGRNTKYSVGLVSPVISNPQPLIVIKLAGAQQLATTTGAGTLSRSFSVGPALINTFSSRYGAVFREFLITRVVATLRATAGNTGQTAAWFDELNATAPTAADAGQNTHVLISNAVGNEPSCATLVWRLAEINDAGFSDCATGSPSPCTLKLYTDANFGTTVAVSSPILMIDWMVTFIFRGSK